MLWEYSSEQNKQMPALQSLHSGGERQTDIYVCMNTDLYTGLYVDRCVYPTWR